MTERDDDLRGSTPVYSAKEILQMLDRKVTELDVKMDGFIMSLQIIVSQKLNERVNELERRGSPSAQEALALAKAHEQQRRQLEGMSALIRGLFGANLLIFIVALTSVLYNIGVLP